jgi:hypothetical protein
MIVAEEDLDEKFSVSYVKNEYGVVINPISRVLDREATAVLRGQMATTKASRRDALGSLGPFQTTLAR